MVSDLFYLDQDLYYAENILNEYEKEKRNKKKEREDALS